MSEDETKTCKMCCMQIPVAARKCPYCLHWQYKLSMITFHPAFALATVTILPFAILLFLYLAIFKPLFDSGEDFGLYAEQIKVMESRIAFGESNSAPVVTVLGTMKNESGIDWTEVQFQVDFLNSEGNMVDAGQQREYFYVLPAGEESSFKVSFRREFPESRYASHRIRVIYAKDAKATF